MRYIKSADQLADVLTKALPRPRYIELLKLLDIYPYTVETKGGSRQIQATTFYITSCKPPEEVYNPHAFDKEERVDQLLRRCK